MLEDIPKDTLSTVIKWIILFGLVVLILIYFDGLLKPLFLALIFWYLIKGTMTLLEKLNFTKYRMPVWFKISLSIILFFGILYSLNELVISRIEQIEENLNVYEQNFQKFLSAVQGLIGEDDIMKDVEQFLRGIDVRSFISNLLSSLTSLVGNVVLVLIYLAFLFVEESVVSNKLENLIKDNEKLEETRRLINQVFSSINKYFRMKTYVSLLTGVLSYIVLLIIGVEFAFLWAFIIFLFNYIPYVGSLVATLLPAVFSLVQFGNFQSFLLVLICVEAIQIMVGNVIEPKFMGKSLNMSPLVVLIALAFWGSIWGVLGMILSVPITSIMIIVMAHFPSTRPAAIILSENGDITELIDPKRT
jgi:predicted PurR-regulated permease PerM